jgi:hypothetical protein
VSGSFRRATVANAGLSCRVANVVVSEPSCQPGPALAGALEKTREVVEA